MWRQFIPGRRGRKEEERKREERKGGRWEGKGEKSEN